MQNQVRKHVLNIEPKQEKSPHRKKVVANKLTTADSICLLVYSGRANEMEDDAISIVFS